MSVQDDYYEIASSLRSSQRRVSDILEDGFPTTDFGNDKKRREGQRRWIPASAEKASLVGQYPPPWRGHDFSKLIFIVRIASLLTIMKLFHS